MFSWSFSKSAEAMFSRWAIKRICKFLLKKKLGKFIMGDIDLNQLDVQLGAGTIQLSDLALNVDYLNEKLGTTPVLLKEGSIGSLMVVMPWKEGGCRVEVDELEVVLAPRRVKASQDNFGTSDHSKNGDNSFSHGDSRKPENETSNSTVPNASVNVHEGVKTIAKMVKWLLSSFYVKINKFIVAFDPHLEDGNGKQLNRILALRIGKTECGTQISEDPSSSNSTTPQNFLGLSRLTTFLKFHGAVLELINVDGLDLQSDGPCSLGDMTTVISGDGGGFSGNLKFSLPWKNGSLDIQKVDADIHIEPLELRLQPSTIKSFIFMWNLFRGISEDIEESCYHESTEYLSAQSESMLSSRKGVFGNEGTATNSSLMDKESVNNLLSESHLISDWVTRSQSDKNEKEPDFGASVDQFFECFDELRNSQSALGSSGMWNWTCSVFSAITAATNLAIGSLHIPSEQQHVETNFNATVGKVSVLLSFVDEDQKQSPKPKDDCSSDNVLIHCLCAQFVNLFFSLQVYPLETNFEGSVQHIEIVDHFYFENDLVHGCSDSFGSEIISIHKMQDSVLGALQNFQDKKKDLGLDHQVDHSGDISLSIQDIKGCCHLTNGKDIYGKYASVTLLRTSDVTSCHVRLDAYPSGGSSTRPVNFSLKLPFFVFWVNFDLICMILKFLREMANSIENAHMGVGFTLDSEFNTDGCSLPGDHGKISYTQTTNLPTRNILKGDIFMPNATVILCFPIGGHKNLSSYSSCNQFIVFDFVSKTFDEKGLQAGKQIHAASSNNRGAVDVSCSLSIKFCDFYLFSVCSSFTENICRETFNTQVASLSVEKIISVVNKTDNQAMLGMLWREGPSTGPWIAEKAKRFASAENGRNENKVAGKGCEFASVTTVKGSNNLDSHTRKEILSSSAFLFHGRLPPVTINLDKSQFENILGLLNQMSKHFSGTVSESVGNQEEHPVSQGSILVEFDNLTVSITIDPVEDVKCSMRSELPGSWHSLTLQVDKFELLSVSDIGGIMNANFLWVSHGRGSLWGSITEALDREFLLISCNDSAMGRGDGEGSNVLSSRQAGSDIMIFRDPESNHSFSSITVKCGTIVAVGGRLDWFNAIFSFFTLTASESDSADDSSPAQTRGSSLVLKLVDVGLSYEPYFKKLPDDQGLYLKYSDSHTHEQDELNYGCLLAASSMKLSNTTLADCSAREYKFELQDLGLLICKMADPKPACHIYGVDCLRRIGYVKVAQEAHVEALLRTTPENGPAWELDCQESHIMFATCHDTTSGLIRLAGQLQSLFAPDMHDYVVHLENRWNNVQQVNKSSDEGKLGGELSESFSSSEIGSPDKRSNSGNLMDEIHEDVFQLDGNSDGRATSRFKSHLPALGTDSSLVASGDLSLEAPDIIEEYFLSDLCPLSELALKSHSSHILGNWNGADAEVIVRNDGWYANSSLKILENHASKVEQNTSKVNCTLKPAECKASISDLEDDDKKTEGHITLKNMNVTWRMYGGSDWLNVQGSCKDSSMTRGRDTTACLELALSGIECDYEVFPEGEISASNLSLAVQDIYLNDRSHDAPWKLVLGYYQSKKHPRNLSSKALRLNLEAVRPDPSILIEENRLRVSLLPVLLHLHQRQLDFLISFFGGKSSSADLSPGTPLDLSKSGESSETHENCAITEEAFLTYFQKFDVFPWLIRVDYSPCRVDLTALRGGKYVELVNLVPWKGVELQLKHVQGVGLYGWSSVCETILGEWLEDISKNQVHKLLKGLPPIKSLVAVGSGAAKLVSLPVKSYREDHRLLKGMQRGTFAFLRSISLEAIGLGVHLAAGTHNILLQAEYILASIPPSVPWPVESRVSTNVQSNQPIGAQEGIQQACQSISDGLGKSASALVQSPLKRYQRGAGMGSALATAVRSAPAAAIAPASATARALHCALLGFRNSLDPERKNESLEKYSGRTPPQN